MFCGSIQNTYEKKKKKCFWRNNFGFKTKLANLTALMSLDSESDQAPLQEPAAVLPVSQRNTPLVS